jgi:hypothetical protein
VRLPSAAISTGLGWSLFAAACVLCNSQAIASAQRPSHILAEETLPGPRVPAPSILGGENRTGPDLPEAPIPQGQVTAAKGTPAEPAAPGRIHGVVVNQNGAVYEGAQVVLACATEASGSATAQTVRDSTTDSSGQFSFSAVPPGAFKLTISSAGFQTQESTGMLHSGESFQAKDVVLLMGGASSEVEVTASRQEIAQAELKEEETQRVLGVIPNFYVSYVPDPAPLTPRQKFSLAWHSSIDPVTFVSVGVSAGIEQANNSFKGYGQGAQGYGKRYGAAYADGFISNMIGGALLASWWKQDPRYFYQGTGTKRSRMVHAIVSSVMCKSDRGQWQVNYSAIVGGWASAGISYAYYPASSRQGAGLIFANSLYGTAGAAIGNLFQEFVVRHLTPRVPNYGAAGQNSGTDGVKP